MTMMMTDDEYNDDDDDGVDYETYTIFVYCVYYAHTTQRKMMF